jgi:toxin CcdB
MLTPQLAGVSRKEMGATVADLSERRNEIIAALDLLTTGI